jgi:hypothetical protein
MPRLTDDQVRILEDMDLVAFVAHSGGGNPQGATIAMHLCRVRSSQVSNKAKNESIEWLKKNGLEHEIDVPIPGEY